MKCDKMHGQIKLIYLMNQLYCSNSKQFLKQMQQPAAVVIAQQEDSSLQFKRILKIVIIISIVYLVFASISIPTLTIVAVIVACCSLLLKIKLAEFRQKGPNNFSPKLRQLLFEKSIFDIYSDILYFPTVSRIIAAFIRPILAKPNPNQLKDSFQNIHPKAKQIISTKGIINIFPEKVRAICQKQNQPLPPVLRQWNWYNADKYKLHEQVHQDTLKKRILDRVDQRINWPMLSVMTLLVAFGIKKMNPKRAQKMLIQNGCFAGVLIVLMIGLIKISRRNKKKHKASHLQIEARIVQE